MSGLRSRATAEGLTAEVRVRLEPNVRNDSPAPTSSCLLAGSVDVPEVAPRLEKFPLVRFLLRHRKQLAPSRRSRLALRAGSRRRFSLDCGTNITSGSGPGQGVYPHLYRAKDSTWLYFMLEALPNKAFYNHSTKLDSKPHSRNPCSLRFPQTRPADHTLPRGAWSPPDPIVFPSLTLGKCDPFQPSCVMKKSSLCSVPWITTVASLLRNGAICHCLCRRAHTLFGKGRHQWGQLPR